MYQVQETNELKHWIAGRGKLTSKICYNHELPLAYLIENKKCPNCSSKRSSNPLGN